MSETRWSIGKSLLWLLGGGAQSLVWLWSFGGAFFLSAFTLLLEAPLLFRIPFFIGSLVLSFAALSQGLAWFASRQRSVSSEDMPARALPAEDRAQVPPLGANSALYPPIRDDELTKTLFEKRTVYLGDFARKASNIRYTTSTLDGLTFIECSIIGPAAVVDLKTGRTQGDNFPDCKWNEGHDAFWAPDFSTTETLVGVIALEDCLFRGCRFSQVAYLYRPSQDEEAEVVELEEGSEEPANPE